MALNKIAKENKYTNKIIAIIMIGFILAGGNSALNSKNNKIEDLNKQLTALTEENKKISSIMNALKLDNNSLINELNNKIQEDDSQKKLVSKIQKIVEDRNFKVNDIDIIRALNSTNNRLSNEYIRVAALVLATMETESGFKYLTNKNNNGTVDTGIMQINEVTVPQLKEALGSDFDPINNKSDNVEAGAYFIYDCYLKAKDKHPEDVIWWTYAYYNRGQFFESTDAWKNANHPSYNKVRKQANQRSEKFRKCYEAYYNALIA